jgi:hypothetical protein
VLTAISLVAGLLGGQAPQAFAADTAPPAISEAPTQGPSLAPRLSAVYPSVLVPEADSTRRPVAIEYSDAYATRLTIHRIASYATLPLYVTQYFVGKSLINDPAQRGTFAKSAHGPLAAAIGGLFIVNAVTGIWNMYDARKDPSGRTRRMVHGISMLIAGAGFVWAGASAPHHEHEDLGGTVPPPPATFTNQANQHQTIAIASMGLSLASYLMMLVWKD